jgi:hypothetical protein
MPEHRHPFPGGGLIVFRATTQFGLAIEESDRFRLPKPGNDLALVFEFGEKVHRNFLPHSWFVVGWEPITQVASRRHHPQQDGFTPPPFPSLRLEQDAHTLGLRDKELLRATIGSPQQMQMRGLSPRRQTAVAGSSPEFEARAV